MMKSFLFRLRFAIKNIIKFPGRSLVVFFTMTISVALFILVMCMNNVLYQIMYNYAQERYLNVDMTLTYDSNSDARILSSRKIEEEYQDYYNFSACFFNYYSLVSADGDDFYSQVFSASVSDLENVIDYDLDTLFATEAFITQSLADEYSLSVGDTITLYVMGTELNYTIKQIVSDRGLFADNSIFVRKKELIEAFYGPTTYIGNIIYFDLKDINNADDLITQLGNDTEYGDFVATTTIDFDKINASTASASAIYIGVGLIILVVIIFVLNSLFPLLFKDFQQQIGVIQILGGNHRFSLSIWVLQFLLFGLLAIPLGVGMAYVLFSQGAEVVEIATPIVLQSDLVMIAMGLFVVFIGTEVIGRYVQLTHHSAVAISYDRRYRTVKSKRILLVVSAFLLIIQLLVHPFAEQYNALVTVILILLIIFSFSDVALELIGGAAKKAKKSSAFSIYGAKNLHENVTIHNSMKVALISAIAIAVTMTTWVFVNTETEKNTAKIIGNYILTNIVNYDVDIKNDIAESYALDSIDEAIVYQNTTMHFIYHGNEKRDNVMFFISIPYEKMGLYFDFEYEGDVATKLADTETPYVVLPYTLAKMNNLAIGDQIIMELSREIPTMTFTIAGFIETNFDEIIFSNLYLLDANTTSELTNSLFINTIAADDTIKNDLIKEYAARMYYLVELDDMTTDIKEQIMELTDYISIIILAVSCALVVVIINNSLLAFYAMKSDYAKMIILGLSISELRRQLVREILILAIIVMLASGVGAFFIIDNLGALMLFGKYYKIIEASVFEVVGRVLVGVVAFVISYGIYLFKIKSINAIEEIRKY